MKNLTEFINGTAPYSTKTDDIVSEGKKLTVNDAKKYFKTLIDDLNKFPGNMEFDIWVDDNAGGHYCIGLDKMEIQNAFGTATSEPDFNPTPMDNSKCWLQIG